MSKQVYSAAGVADANSGGVNGITEKLDNISISGTKKRTGGQRVHKKQKSKRTKSRSNKRKNRRATKTRRYRK